MKAPYPTPARWSITAVGVVVPAHNEATHIDACLNSVRAALDALPAAVARTVCVVLDRCTDATAECAMAVIESPGKVSPGRPVVIDMLENAVPGAVGTLRDLGLRHGMARLHEHPPERTWLLSTDADTTVPPTWALDHLRHAHRGAHAVAGLADLDDPSTPASTRWDSYSRHIAAGITRGRHSHVYAANLGVRADAYLDVGGFPAVPHGEDHALCRLLRGANHPVATPTDVRVQTSSRLHGRATGGLADLLRSLSATPLPAALGLPATLGPAAGTGAS